MYHSSSQAQPEQATASSIPGYNDNDRGMWLVRCGVYGAGALLLGASAALIIFGGQQEGRAGVTHQQAIIARHTAVNTLTTLDRSPAADTDKLITLVNQSDTQANALAAQSDDLAASAHNKGSWAGDGIGLVSVVLTAACVSQIISKAGRRPEEVAPEAAAQVVATAT